MDLGLSLFLIPSPFTENDIKGLWEWDIFSTPSSINFVMKKIISTANAPGAIGPYNQAIIYNGILYASGQIAIDPATGELVQDSLEAETHQVLKNVGAILEAAGCSYQDVLKASVFIKDMHQFARINTVYAEYFDPAWAPARETVEVANLPKFVNVEISVIAAVG